LVERCDVLFPEILWLPLPKGQSGCSTCCIHIAIGDQLANCWIALHHCEATARTTSFRRK